MIGGYRHDIGSVGPWVYAVLTPKGFMAWGGGFVVETDPLFERKVARFTLPVTVQAGESVVKLD